MSACCSARSWGSLRGALGRSLVSARTGLSVGVTVGALALSAGGSVASADVPVFPSEAPVVSTPVIRASLRIAVAYWSANPCPTGFAVRIAELSSDGSTPDGAAPIERVWGDRRCDIVLSPAIAMRFVGVEDDYQDNIRECGAIVHAVEHAIDPSRPHSDDVHSIFNAAPSATVRPCYKRFKPKRVTIRQDRSLYERIWATRS